ncbi:MAG: two component transcriptional regulator, LuxR family [Klenkia sp.]|nr:two component transcriptional regulator, LuxR family [Klenkia sp.]
MPTVLAPTASLRTVLVVDDHRSFAELLSAALGQAGMLPVGVAGSFDEAVEAVLRLRPDVVVMDVQMPGQDGIAATRRIRELAPDTVIAVVTAHSDPDWVARAGQAGASAFIPKNGSLTEMIEVLDHCRAGQMLVARSVFTHPAVPAVPGPGPGPAAPRLTDRERDVLACLGRGMPVKSAARVLGISLETCRGYVKSLHHKLDASSQLEVVIRAQALGLVDVPDSPAVGR